jgi:membrane protease subunit (stomatin/prohibitin family)
MRWGTKDSVAFKDRELGLIRLLAFGTFTMKITQPILSISTIVGTQGSFGTNNVEDYLREIIVSRFNDFLGQTVESILDLPKHHDEMSNKTNMPDLF